VKRICQALRRVQAHTLGGCAAVAVIAVLTAACGGGGSATGSGSPSPSASSAFDQALALARCMRAHGAPNFPDPNSDGSFPSGNSDIPPSAARACGNLEGGIKQSHAAQLQNQYNAELRVSQCVRAHGYPTFPDPAPPGSGGQSAGSPRGIDLNSPQFKAVLSSCQKRYLGSSNPATSGPSGISAGNG
jgi:hypothetical protein